MNKRLLTDEEIQKSYDLPFEPELYPTSKRLMRLQDGKTASAVRKEIGEWLDKWAREDYLNWERFSSGVDRLLSGQSPKVR